MGVMRCLRNYLQRIGRQLNVQEKVTIDGLQRVKAYLWGRGAKEGIKSAGLGSRGARVRCFYDLLGPAVRVAGRLCKQPSQSRARELSQGSSAGRRLPAQLQHKEASLL